jgi:ABC-2 type transport system permease protein
MAKKEKVSDLLIELKEACYIAMKDVKIYFFKAPNFTYSFLIPISLFLAFSISNKIEPIIVISGLTTLVILFGTTSIEAVSVVLEKQTGTFERLLIAPISFFYILLGKALAGTLFGLITAIIVMVPLMIISGTFLVNPLLILITILITSFCFSMLGVLISAYAKWVPEAQMISNFIRFPMIFICGTFISLDLLPSLQRVIALFLPLTYAIEALRISLNGTQNLLNFFYYMLILIVFSLVFLIAAAKILKKRTM